MTEWINVAKLEDIPRQGARVVRTAAGEIAIFRTVDDEVFALRDKCPHKGGPLSQGIVHGKRSPARCTTGRSTSIPASPSRPMSAARRAFLCG